MATEMELGIQELAKVLEKGLSDMYGEPMGFILLVSPWSTGDSICDYISNGNRGNCIEWMKATVERFEKKDFIPTTEGNA